MTRRPKNPQAGRRFQDRKLNACDTCGTHHGLAMHFRADGRLYFLCQAHTIILEALIADAARVGVRL